ncbi:MAG TPA: CHAP domain-containing protein [Pseudomonadales bacterium]|nr:CHAP domain-containing protein [Pseudomonadales bacterium]
MRKKKRFAPRANKVARIAKSQVGYHEGRSGGHWNNKQKYSGQVPGLEWSNNQPWCATFVSWVVMVAKVGHLYPRTASCDVGAGWFKARGQWSEYPAKGAQVFFGYPHDLVHTGIVTDFDDTYIYTVEGNTNGDGSREGDGVYFKKRLRRDPWVVGYGYPDFNLPLKSADPFYRNE